MPSSATSTSKRILGIDPGTGICGFGVIETTGRGINVRMLDCGVITTPHHTPLPERLLDIYNSLHEVIETNQPDCVSIEKLFFSKNITTGISVAEARGVCILVARQCNLPIFEYTPNEIKQTMTGYGGADKSQMQEMVRQHLKLAEVPKPDDAADALAAAITHSLMLKTLNV
ncbi:crossover junction endodeoxyribonuclease RuvC [Candidatus Saccharibacteria bacterium]|nr:crossover junction endodeoxyribonuclease RuvC [Candidatus Saccharibacteria bacterium]